MSLKIDHISPSFISDLDIALPDWRNLISEDNPEELDEEALIQLLKNKKRAETYRAIADKRNIMFKEMYTSEDKSVLDLTKEFGYFSHEQTAKWWEIEGKLNSVILQFRSKQKIEDIKQLRPSFNIITQAINEVLDESAKATESNMKTIMNNTINRVTGGRDEETRKLNELFNTQIPKFQQDNKQVFDDYKEFINSSIGGLIQSKISKIESGELDLESLQRSDLFTDEEEQELGNKFIQTIEKMVGRGCDLSAESFQDFAIKSGLEGRNQFLQKVNDISTDLIPYEVKQTISGAIANNFIFPFEKEQTSSRDKRALFAPFFFALVNCFFKKALNPRAEKIQKIVSWTTNILDSAASSALEESKREKDRAPERSEFFKWCNKGTYGLGHIMTLGFCSGWSIGELAGRSLSGENVDRSDYLEVIGYCISFASFLISFSHDRFCAVLDLALNFLCNRIFDFIEGKFSGQFPKKSLSSLCGIWNGILRRLAGVVMEFTFSQSLKLATDKGWI